MSGWNSPLLLTMFVSLYLYSLFLNKSLKGMEIFTFESYVCKLKVETNFSTSTNTGCFTSLVFLFYSLVLYTPWDLFFCWLLEGLVWFNLPLFTLTSLLLNFIFLCTSSITCRYPLWYYSDATSKSISSYSWENMMCSSSMRYISESKSPKWWIWSSMSLASS